MRNRWIAMLSVLAVLTFVTAGHASEQTQEEKLAFMAAFEQWCKANLTGQVDVKITATRGEATSRRAGTRLPDFISANAVLQFAPFSQGVTSDSWDTQNRLISPGTKVNDVSARQLGGLSMDAKREGRKVFTNTVSWRRGPWRLDLRVEYETEPANTDPDGNAKARSEAMRLAAELDRFLARPTEEVKYPVVFVHGIAGSRLCLEADGKEAWPGLNVLTRAKPNTLALPESGIPNATTVPMSPAWMDSLAFGAFDVYGSMVNALEGAGYKKSEKLLYTVSYDWRLDNTARDTHTEADYTGSAFQLEKIISRALGESRTSKVVLLAHSLGGLACREYLAKRGEQNVAKLITIATPYQGAPKAYYAMLQGYSFGNLAQSDCQMMFLARNWPGAYQLLPWEPFIMGKQQEYWPLDTSYAVICNRPYAPNLLRDVVPLMWKRTGSSADFSWTLNQDLVRTAAAFRAGQREPPSIPTYVIIGVNQPTLGRYSAHPCRQAGDIAPSVRKGDDFYFFHPLVEDGDETVPLWSADPPNLCMPSLNPALKGKFYVEGTHGGLPGQANVQQIVVNILKDTLENAFPPKPPEPQHQWTLDLAIYCPASLHFYDRADRHNGVNEYGAIESGIPRSTFLRDEDRQYCFLYNATGPYRGRVAAYDAGEFTLVITARGAGKAKTFTYPHVKIERDSVAAFEIPSVAAMIDHPPKVKVTARGQQTTVTPQVTDALPPDKPIVNDRSPAGVAGDRSPSSSAAEIRGTVVRVDGNGVRIEVSGDRVPDVGDKVAIFQVLPDTDIEASVASGQVTAVVQRVVEVQVLAATSQVRKGHLVRFAAVGRAVPKDSPPPGSSSGERWVEQPPAAAERILVDFPTPKQPSVDEIRVIDASDGGILTIRFKIWDEERPLKVGWHLGMASRSAPDDRPEIPDELHVFRAEVTEVRRSSAVVRVGATAHAKLQRIGLEITLFPAAELPATQIQHLPDWLPLEVPQATGLAATAAAINAAAMNCLRNIAIAMHGFEIDHHGFPPAIVYGPDGKPWHSWRVYLLPYLSADHLYKRYNFREPWDSPGNLRLLKEMPEIYGGRSREDDQAGYTNFAVPVGPDVAFRDDPKSRLAPHDGPLPEGLGRRSGEFDLPAATILVGCVPDDRKIPWTKPEDVLVGDKPAAIGAAQGFGMYELSGRKFAPFAFADGHVGTIPGDTPVETLAKFLRVSGRQPGDADELAELCQRTPLPDFVPVIRVVETATGPRARLLFSAADADEANRAGEHEQRELDVSPSPGMRDMDERRGTPDTTDGEGPVELQARDPLTGAVAVPGQPNVFRLVDGRFTPAPGYHWAANPGDDADADLRVIPIRIPTELANPPEGSRIAPPRTVKPQRGTPIPQSTRH